MNEIEILKKNVRDLQEQLRTAYVRIKQLNEELDKLKIALDAAEARELTNEFNIQLGTLKEQNKQLTKRHSFFWERRSSNHHQHGSPNRCKIDEESMLCRGWLSRTGAGRQMSPNLLFFRSLSLQNYFLSGDK